MKKYKRKSNSVVAVQYAEDNMKSMIKILKGRVDSVTHYPCNRYSLSILLRNANMEILMCYGDWVVWDKKEKLISIYTNKEFEKLFKTK